MPQVLDIADLESIIKYSFNDKKLLEQALTHSSYANERKINKSEDYERLEFLGDAVLELVSSEFLFHNNPELAEGKLTKLRSSMVCEPALAYCAREIGLEQYIRLGKGEEHTGGRDRDSIISDVMEAVIGAIYLDGGIAPANDYIHRFILSDKLVEGIVTAVSAHHDDHDAVFVFVSRRTYHLTSGFDFRFLINLRWSEIILNTVSVVSVFKRQLSFYIADRHRINTAVSLKKR